MKEPFSRKPGGSSRSGRPLVVSGGRPETTLDQACDLRSRYTLERPVLLATLEIGWSLREPREGNAVG